MYLGEAVLLKHNNKLVEGRVREIFPEELNIELDNKEMVRAKFWEVRKVKTNNEE